MTDILFDCLMERVSWEVKVFCLETGWKEEAEEVVEAREALDAGWSIVATDIVKWN